jgi:starch synthase (maltosyl-transferring)
LDVDDAAAARRRRVIIETVNPSVDGGRYPIKRIVGQPIDVEADVFAEGHDLLRVVLAHRFVPFDAAANDWTTAPMRLIGNDVWTTRIVPDSKGWIEYFVSGWVDAFETWRHEIEVKAKAGMSVASELLEGAAMIRRVATSLRASPAGAGAETNGERQAAADRLAAWADHIAGDAGEPDRVRTALASELAADMAAWDTPVYPARSPVYRARIERDAAGFAAWYEMFPRSETPDPSRSATFDEAARRLPAVAGMGFDVVYLPPIHPIGHTARKGRNNTLEPAARDPGSPWAIGSEEGGHKAVHPDLGTIEDFDRFVEAARRAGLEVALDLAYQCSPDHPYVREHPEWFRHRPDGSIKYAENPPKKYQDIYPLNFDTDAADALWEELKSVVLFWIDHGVHTFRVDNPHTKPFAFWEWMIAEVQREHPDAVFLSEAFTRPKIMRRLAKIGFTQSYSYFTWRNARAELTEYFTELSTPPVSDYMRANLFANTPDILHAYLQAGGRPAFQVRLILAATLGSLYGIYSGYELSENVPVRPGSEEYLHSEKYEYRPRDWQQPGSLAPLITLLNLVRRQHPAFRPGGRLDFHPTDNDMLLCYSRESDDGRDRLIVVVNLDPFHMQHGWVQAPPDRWALPERFAVLDALDGRTFHWQRGANYVRLEPGASPAHVLVCPPAGSVAV